MRNIDLNFDAFVVEDEETLALSRYVQEIVRLSLNIKDFSIKVLDGEKILSVFDSSQVTITHKYVVLICADGVSEFCKKLSKFIKCDVQSISDSIIFWEEGDSLDVADKTKLGVAANNVTSPPTDASVKFRMSETVLPPWLDNILYNELNAVYAPEHKRYEYNLDLNEAELKVYLGTYFPRSYAEMFCIVDNLMQNERIRKSFTQDEVNVLDLGCGTGGELVGLMVALSKYLSNENISVMAIDGNGGALTLLEKIVERFSNRDRKHHVKLVTSCVAINGERDLCKFIAEMKRFHFILCDKVVCELMAKGILSSDAYGTMARELSPHLHENGLLIMLDVTTRDIRTGLFYPQLMNRSINEYVRNDKAIETLLPLSCAHNEVCKDLCFMQQSFIVSHSRKANDESKVCYRILCSDNFKETIMQGVNAEDMLHIIHPKKYKTKEIGALCPQTSMGTNIIDTFNINQ